jgi:hypothetical protein
MSKEARTPAIPAPTTAKVRLESPDALFAPDHRIQLPVPAPLYLLSCLRLPLDPAYEMTEDGVVRNPEHAFQRNTIVYPDGKRFEAEVSGSPALGLPNIYDLDYLLGIGQLVEELGTTPDGRIDGATYRAILRATRPGTSRVSGSSKQIAALKRALGRWANTTVRTSMEMVYEEAADLKQGRAGRRSPTRRERESTHWILEYDLEREERGGRTSEVIELLRVNPIWNAQTSQGLAAWLDLDLHNSLRSGVAKGIYLRLVLAVAQGWQPAMHTELLGTWIEALGVSSREAMSRIAARFGSALAELQAAGAVDLFAVAPVRRGVYEVQLMPGEAVCHIADQRSIGTLDPVRTRVLLAHLARYRLEGEGRSLLQRHGLRVQEVLQWVHYLRTEREGKDARGKPIVSWRAWILQALSDDWTFDDAEYRAWLARRLRLLTEPAAQPRPAPQIAPASVVPEPLSPAAPSPDFTASDDAWGRALRALRADVPAESFRAWFHDTWLEEIADDVVRVGTTNDFARQWILTRWGERLQTLLADELGRPVQLDIDTIRPPKP